MCQLAGGGSGHYISCHAAAYCAWRMLCQLPRSCKAWCGSCHVVADPVCVACHAGVHPVASAASPWQIVICTWYVSCLAVVNPGVVAATWWQFVLCRVPCGCTCCCVSCHSVADFAWRLVGQLPRSGMAWSGSCHVVADPIVSAAMWWLIALRQLPRRRRLCSARGASAFSQWQILVRFLARGGRSRFVCCRAGAHRVASAATAWQIVFGTWCVSCFAVASPGVVAATWWQIMLCELP